MEEEEFADLNALERDFMLASLHGTIATVEMCLIKGVLVNVQDLRGRTALHLAYWGGHFDIVRLLLKKMADVNPPCNIGFTPLIAASDKGNEKIVSLLLEDPRIGIEINSSDSDGNTALVRGCSNGHVKIVRLLLDKKAKVNLSNNKGITPLIAASDKGLEKIVKLLLEDQRIKINSSDSDGNTALVRACLNGNVKIVRLLLDKKAEVNSPNPNGCTPLMAAGRNGHVQILKPLLEAGAKPDQKTHKGNTALHLAIQHSIIEAAELLMDHGADLFAEKNDDGKTPLDCAESDEIKARLCLYDKVHKLRQELHDATNFLCVTSIGNITAANDRYATLEGKLEQATRDIAHLRQENAQLHGTVGQLQNTVDELRNTIDERQKTD